MPPYGRVAAFLAGQNPGPEPAGSDPVTGEPLYLPEGWGGPSPSEFNQPDTSPAPPSTREAMRGTMFDLEDPIAGYLREQDLTSPIAGMTDEDFRYGLPSPSTQAARGPVASGIDSALRRFLRPQPEAQEAARQYGETEDRSLEQTPPAAAWEGFKRGAAEGGAAMTSGLDLLMNASLGAAGVRGAVGVGRAALGVSRAGRTAAEAARLPGTLQSGLTAARTGADAAVSTGLLARGGAVLGETVVDWDQMSPSERAIAIGGGVADVAFGAHGVRANVTEPIRTEFAKQNDFQARLDAAEALDARIGLEQRAGSGGKDYRGFNRARNDPEWANKQRAEAERLAAEMQDADVRARAADPEAQGSQAWWDRVDAAMRDVDRQRARARASGRMDYESTPPEDPFAPDATAAPPGPPPGAAPAEEYSAVRRFLEGAPEDVPLRQGEIAGFEPQLPGTVERGHLIERVKPMEVEAPRQPFTGGPLEASMRPGPLSDAELRTAYIDAATAGDTYSLGILDDELSVRRALGAAPRPIDTTPSPFFDQEGRFTLDVGDSALPPEAQPLSPQPPAQTVEALFDTTPSPYFDPEGRFTLEGDPHPIGLPPEVSGSAPPPSAASTVEALLQGAPEIQGGRAPSRGIVSLSPQEVGQIAIDPQTYQFKTADARGRTGALEGVTEWDPDAPPITVHQRDDGRLFVADGHQRFNKYLELMQQGRPLSPLQVKIKTGPVEDIVRGASLRNVQEGSADPLDIARLIRNGGPLTPAEVARVPKKALAGAKLRQGTSLAVLGDDAFNQVLAGVVKPEFAAYVGEHIADPAQQATILQQLGAAQLENAAQAEAFVRSMRTAGFVTEHQVDLFGNRVEAVSLAKPKAQIVDETGKFLRSQRSAFSNALRNADQLEAAGNTLVREINAKHADDAGKLKAYFDLLYDKLGTETNRALNDAALALHGGQLTRADAARQVAAAVQRDIASGNFGAAPAGRQPSGPRDDGRLATGTDGPPPQAVQPVADATPEEARQILQDLHALTSAPGANISLEPPPLRLAPTEGATALEPSRLDLEAAGQGSMFGPEGDTTPPKPEVRSPAAAASVTPPVTPELPIGFVKARTRLENWIENTWPSKGTPEHPVPPAQLSQNKEMVRGAMDRIVAQHPKDPIAQAKAADEWIARWQADVDAANARPESEGGLPKARAAADETPWEPLSGEHGGQQRTVEGPAGRVHEIKFAEKPPEGVRKQLSQAGYKYDYRDTTWRSSGQEKPASALPQEPSSPRPSVDAASPSPAPSAQEPLPQLPSKAERARLVAQSAARREAAMQPHATAVEPSTTDLARPKQDNAAAIQRHEGRVGEAGPVPPHIAAKAPEALALTKALEAWPAKGDPRAEGMAPRQVKQRAERMTAFLNDPNEGNFKTWIDEVKADAERQGKDALRTGKEGGGTYLASGFAGLEQMFKENPAQAWLLARMAAGGLVGALADEDDPALGGVIGAAAGAMLSPKFLKASLAMAKKAGVEGGSAWTAMKHAVSTSAPRGVLPKLRYPGVKPGQEMSLAQWLRRPEGAFPEHFARLHPAEHDLESFLSTGRLPSGKKATDLFGEMPPGEDFYRNPRKVFLAEALRELRKDIRESIDAGHRTRANYLTLLERAATNEPALIYQMLPKGDVLAKIDSAVTNHAYRLLLGLGIDTGLANKTQILYNLKNIGLKDVLHGIRESWTPEGKARTADLRIHRPMDVEESLRTGKVGQVVDEWMHKPLLASDTGNRKQSFLAAEKFALDRGATPEAAREWALANMRQTQSEPGAAGKHPILHQAGPLKMFANYPHLWAELMADTLLLAKENPMGAARLAGFMIAGGAAMKAAGFDPMNLFVPRFAVTTAVPGMLADAASHLGIGATPDHRFTEDLAGVGNKPGLLVPRYVKKAWREMGHVAGKGVDEKTGEHIERDAKGRETGRHSTFEGLSNLLGLDPDRRSKAIKLSNDIFDYSADAKTEKGITRRQHQAALADAIDANDPDAVREILRALTPRARREMRRAVGQSKWQRLRGQVPRAQRAEFDQMFGERIRQAEGR